MKTGDACTVSVGEPWDFANDHGVLRGSIVRIVSPQLALVRLTTMLPLNNGTDSLTQQGFQLPANSTRPLIQSHQPDLSGASLSLYPCPFQAAQYQRCS